MDEMEQNGEVKEDRDLDYDQEQEPEEEEEGPGDARKRGRLERGGQNGEAQSEEAEEQDYTLGASELKKPKLDDQKQGIEGVQGDPLTFDHLVKISGLPWRFSEADVLQLLDGITKRPRIRIFDSRRPLTRAGPSLGDVPWRYRAAVRQSSKRAQDIVRPSLLPFLMANLVFEVSFSTAFKPGPRGYLRMRGLPYISTDQDIKNFFEGFAVVPGGVHIIFDQMGRPSGQAFVELETIGEAQLALRLDKERIGERWIDLFPSSRDDMLRAIPTLGARGGRAGRGMRGSAHGPIDDGGSLNDLQYVIKLRGLPFDVERQAVIDWFEDAKPRDNHVFFVNRMDGRASGEAFVVFNTREALQKALGRDKQKMGNRWLDIFESHVGDLITRVGAAVSQCSRKDTGYRGVVKMRGLPFQVTVDDILSFFSGYNLQQHGIYITTGADGRATGEAFVVFGSEADAIDAQRSRDRQTINSRWVELLLASKGDLYSATIYSPVVGQAAGGCPLYANVPMTCARMKGLPHSVNEDDLFRFFNGLKVIGLYICRDQAGRSTGEAYAEFGSLDDCQQAMSRNRDKLPSSDTYVEVTAASKEEVLELIEMEKRGETQAFAGSSSYVGTGPYHPPAPVDYASMARGRSSNDYNEYAASDMGYGGGYMDGSYGGRGGPYDPVRGPRSHQASRAYDFPSRGGARGAGLAYNGGYRGGYMYDRR